jgi:hypothetical protein
VFLIGLYRWFPLILKVLTIIQPETPASAHGQLLPLLVLEIALMGHPARDGGPSCATTRQTLPPWTCSLSDVRFDLLYAFLIVRLGRRDLIWINVTTNPTTEWIARQLTEAFP